MNIKAREEQFNYLVKIFPFIDLPFFVLVIIYSDNWIASLCISPLFMLISSTVVKLSKHYSFNPGPYIMLFNSSLFVTYVVVSGPEAPAWLTIINITIGATFMLKKPIHGQLLVSMFSVGCACLYYYMGASIQYSLIILFSLLAIILLFSRAHGYMALQQEKIEKKSKEVLNQKKELLDSIRYAKRIQSAILPPNRLIKDALKNVFVLYKPKDIVAGDFYWIEPTKRGVFFAAADCTGHGVPGAMVSVICNGGLNRSLHEFGLEGTGQILDKTRELVIKEFEKSEEEVKDGMDIALCKLEGTSLSYSGANNPLWIVRDGEVLETKADKQPIGKHDTFKPFSTYTIELVKGDTIYVFSDGFSDQFGGEKGKKYKSGNFKKFLISIQEQSMDEQHKLLDQEFENWRGKLEQIDDVCVIGVRI